MFSLSTVSLWIPIVLGLVFAVLGLYFIVNVIRLDSKNHRPH